MDTREHEMHSFIVKLWLDEVGDETERLFWHGSITHVPSGDRRTLKALSDIGGFIERYLPNPEDKSGPGSPLRC